MADLNSKLQKALAQLDRLLVRQNIVYSQEINEKLDRVAIDTTRVISMMTAPPRVDALAKLRSVLDLPPDCEIDRDYNSFLSNLEPGTREWFLQHPQFLKWRNSRRSVLSVLGGPGSGKSFLSTKIIQHLKAHLATSPERSYLTYHYYHASDSFSRSLTGALSIFTYQLAVQDAAFAELAASTCDHLSTQSTHFETSLWHEVMIKSFTSACRGKLVMIFDGIDEAVRDGMKRCIVNVQKLLDLQMDINVLFVGRPEMEAVLEPLEGFSVGIIRLSSGLLASDIARFIDAKYDTYMSKHSKIRGERELITKTLREKANGMFLWVDLVYQELKRIKSPKARRQALENIPSGLRGLYDTIFTRIKDDLQSEKAIQQISYLLSFIVYTTDVQSVYRLNLFISYASNDDTFEADEFISSVCSSLLELNDSRSEMYNLQKGIKSSLIHDSGLIFPNDDLNDMNSEDIAKDEEELDEDEAEEIERYRQLNVMVRPRHASLVNYLDDEKDPNVAAILNSVKLHVDLSKAHFQAFVSGPENAEELWKYAAQGLLPQLMLLLHCNLNVEHVRDLIELIHKAFTSTEILRYVVDPYGILSFSDNPFTLHFNSQFNTTIGSIFKQWLGILFDSGANANLAPNLHQWTRRIAASPNTLFMEMANESIEAWLSNPDIDSHSLRDRFWFASACASFSGLTTFGEVGVGIQGDWELKVLESGFNPWDILAGLRIKDWTEAEFCLLARTASSRFPEKTKEYYQKAISVAQGIPDINRKRLKAAYEECAIESIDWDTFTHESLLENVIGEYFALDNSEKPYFMYACLGVSEQYKNPSKAIAAFRKALELEQNDTRVWGGLMELWRRQENWDSIMGLLEETTATSISSTSALEGGKYVLTTHWKLVTHAARKTQKLQLLLEVIDRVIHAPSSQDGDHVWLKRYLVSDHGFGVIQWLDLLTWLPPGPEATSRKILQCQQAMLWRYDLENQGEASSLFQEALLSSSDIYHFEKVTNSKTPGIWAPEFDSRLPWFMYQYIEVLAEKIDSADSDTTQTAAYQSLMLMIKRCEVMTRIFSDPDSGNMKERELARLVAVILHKHRKPDRACAILQQHFQLVLGMIRGTIRDSLIYGPWLLSKVLHTTGYAKDAAIAMSIARFSRFCPKTNVSHKPHSAEDDATTSKGYVNLNGTQNEEDSNDDEIQLAMSDYAESDNTCSNDYDCLRPADQRLKLIGSREVSYHCMSCYQVVFCEPCYQLHVHGNKADKADRVRWCNPNHPLIKLPIENWTLRYRDEDKFSLTQYVMTIDGEEITVGEWLDRIESAWTPTIVVY